MSTSVDSSLPTENLTPTQLSSIKAQLDLILLALEALTGLGSEAMLAAAKELRLDTVLSDRVSLWRLRQASPLRKGQGRKKLDVDEARALVLIACKLASGHQAQIRQAVARLEQLSAKHEPPYRAALLGDYLDSFSNTYQERMEGDANISPQALSDLALRLLVDLLFYSGTGGTRRLWLALLDRSQENQ
ncbi:MAG: DUF3038 domain-containing protein [Leptolyngbya sp. SIO4C1]|nr:DUF3038 domain-containing protein [Leptolyngbya sp. SIO4C1]